MSTVDNEHLSKRLLDLQTFLYSFGEIDRMIFLPDGKRKDRRETDTEHSYHIAMLAWYASQFFPELDKSKVIQYALVHDIVEIYAGDVMAIGRTKEEQRLKDERERAAIGKLRKEWPDFADLTTTITAYEAQTDAESVFVKALDKLTPMLHNILGEGKTWKKWDMDRRAIIDNKDEKTKRSPQVNRLWQEFRKTILEHDEWFNEGKAS